MSISVRQLRLFLVLAKTLNFSRAAEKCHMTQPALSKIIKELELELGVELFERTTRSVRLTIEGARLIPSAMQALSGFDSGITAMQRQAENYTQHVSVGALPSLASILLPPVMRKLKCCQKNISINVYDGSTDATLNRTTTGQVHCALSSINPSKPTLHYEELIRDRFVLLSYGGLAQQLNSIVKLADLHSLPLITMTNASSAMQYMVASFLQRDEQFSPKLQLDQLGTIVSFVRNEIGIAVLPYLSVHSLLINNDFAMSLIEDGPTRSVGIVTRSGEPLSSVCQCVISLVREEARNVIKERPDWLLPPISGS